MANWIKKINFSSVIIAIASGIQYVNDMYFHNLPLYILNDAYLVGLLILTIGFLWNNETTKIFTYDKNKVIEPRIRAKIDIKMMMRKIDLRKYFREQYIHNKIDDLK